MHACSEYPTTTKTYKNLCSIGLDDLARTNLLVESEIGLFLVCVVFVALIEILAQYDISVFAHSLKSSLLANGRDVCAT